MRLAWVLVLAVATTACSASTPIRLSTWTLAVPGAPDRAVTLPARFDSVPDGITYTLATDVELPPALRGRPLTFTVTHLRAPATLRVDGVEAAPIDGRGLAPYHAWRFVPTSSRIRVEIEIEHSSFFGNRIGVAPELGSETSTSFLLARAAAGTAALVTVVLATLMALIYAVTWLLDRRRAAHGWFALQAILVTPSYAAVFGGTPAGGFAVALMYFCMVAAAIAGLAFVHAEFGLGRVPRLFLALGAIALVDLVLEPDAFAGAQHQELALYVIGLPVCAYVIVRLIQVARRAGPDRAGAALFALAWGVFLLSAVPDVLIAAGRADLVAGMYGSPTGVALYVLVHALVLARDRALSARRQEELNRELRRQVAERSRALADALGTLQKAREAVLEPGAVVNARYRIGDLLGRGGMGNVYACERIEDGAGFALKVVRGAATPAAMARFAREAEIAAGLDDPHLVAVRDIGVTDAGVLFLVMDLERGASLEGERARFGDVAWAITVLRDVARGLAALHAGGVVHRDLKPSNILLGEHGARIADFGVATLMAPPATGLDETVDAASPLTRTGAIVGTLLYMAPELASGATREPQPASDVFSLGIVAYEVLARRLPFEDRSHLSSIVPLGEVAPTVPAAIAVLVDRSLSLDPVQRPTAVELAAALAQ